ncbi:hypothetical protein, partial [Streptomyces sp. NPDC047972]|uniref:hypothetical protein n=1 Tax=Streptomyces sp. NPDC047972 TaxID=3365493 RepID=UPI003724930B
RAFRYHFALPWSGFLLVFSGIAFSRLVAAPSLAAPSLAASTNSRSGYFALGRLLQCFSSTMLFGLNAFIFSRSGYFACGFYNAVFAQRLITMLLPYFAQRLFTMLFIGVKPARLL